MVDFRYHIVSLVAVFLALAIGIVLGTTTLNGPILHDLQGRSHGLASEKSHLEHDVSQLDSQLRQEQGVVTQLGQYAVEDRLAGLSVVLVSTPGVSSGMRNAVVAMLSSAGATVAADLRLRPAYLDPTQDALLGTLATRLAGRRAPLPGTTGAEQAAAQLASVLVGKPRRRPDSPAAADALATALSAYENAQLLYVSGPPPRRGSAAVVLVAAPPGPSPAPGAGGAANPGSDVVALAQALDQQSAGAVLAGPAAAATTDGALGVARGTRSAPLATVDSADAPDGPFAVVLTLAARLAGRVGAYGSMAGDSGLFPPRLPGT